VVQDAFVKAYVRWRRLARYDRPGAWVRRVAIRDAVRIAARQARGVPVDDRFDDAIAGVVDQVDLRRAIAGLPPQQRAALVLHHLEDWPVRDVADALGCKEPTVRVHLHRARTALAEVLGPDHEEVDDGR
jgi:RNA polymerase sigma-70 factor (ECF subfamily)